MKGIALLLFACFMHTGHAQHCVSELNGWKGSFYFPQMRENHADRPFYTKNESKKDDCIFYMNTKLAVSVKLTFGMMKIGDAKIQVKTLPKSGRKWEGFKNISGVIPEWIDLEVHDVAHLKIVVPKSSGSFFVDYELITCRLPIGMEAVACTRENYIGSQCIFKCGENSYSLNPKQQNYHARCGKKTAGGKVTYDWKFSPPGRNGICVWKSDVEKRCFSEEVDDTCPFKLNDLLTLMGERYDIPERKERPILTFASGAVAGSRGLFAPISPHGPAVMERCLKNFCGLAKTSGKYSPTCGGMGKERRKKRCMFCRYYDPAPCKSANVFE